MKRTIVLLAIMVIISCSKKQSDPQTLLKEGQELYLAGKYFEARQVFLEGIQLAPSDKDLLYYAGLSYQKEYVYDSALFYFKRADFLYPDSREINLALYQVAPKIEDWDYALEAIRKLVHLGDPEEPYLQELADFSRFKRAFVHTMYYARKMLSLNQDDPNKYLYMVNASISAGSLMTANAYIDSAMDKFGELTELTANRGAILSMSGKYSEAESIFRDLLIQDPDNPSLLLNLANTLASTEINSKKEEALDLFTKLRTEFGTGMGIDSLITELKIDLGISQ